MSVKPIDRMLAKFPDAVAGGNGWWNARCPAHDDRVASFGFTEGTDGTVGIKCLAGCDKEQILGLIGMQFSDLFPSNGHVKTPKTQKPPKKPTGRAYSRAKKALAALDSRMAEEEQGKRVAKWHYRDQDGNFIALVVRYETPKGKTFRPISKWEDGWHLCDPPDLWPVYRPSNNKVGSEVWVPEGEKCADALAGLGLFSVTSAHGSQSARKTDWKPLAGTQVFALPDNDDAGRKYANDVATILTRLKAEVKIVPLTWDGMGKGDDVVDWIGHWRANGKDEKWLASELKRLAEEAPEPQEAGIKEPIAHAEADDDRPVIEITTEEHEVNRQAVEALAKDRTIYQRGGTLVHVVRDKSPATKGIRRPHAPRIEALPLALLRERLAKNVRWVTINAKGEEKEAHPPGWCVAAVQSRSNWPGVRHLEAIVEYPVLRRDGTILSKKGYDAETGLLLMPKGKVPRVPMNPTHADAIAARDKVLEVVCDFPFQAEVHKAAWLAALLTVLARFAFEGPAPLFLIDANTRGSGKGLLGNVIAMIVTGARATVTSYTDDANELRKRITALALEGDRFVMFDNLAGKFGNHVLDAALTATTWKDRLLGVNKIVVAPLFMVWFATGNNVNVADDTARRTYHIRLESNLEKPETRSGFRHKYLLNHVSRNREELLAATLTILRAYFACGKPNTNLPAYGSFEEWSRLVRHCVVWLGMPDPDQSRMMLQERTDLGAESMRLLLSAWKKMDPNGRGKTAAEVIRELYKEQPVPTPDWHERLRVAIESLVDHDKPTSKHLGCKLREFQRRIFEGRFMDNVGSKKNAIKWAVFDANDFQGKADEGAEMVRMVSLVRMFSPNGKSKKGETAQEPEFRNGNGWKHANQPNYPNPLTGGNT